MRLLFMGPPGAGKGTQAQAISKRLNVPQISTGDILRMAVKSGSQLGKRAEEYMNAGLLVPDELVIGIVQERLGGQDASQGFILDGFPRNVSQADRLDTMLKDLGERLDRAFNLEVPREELVKRLVKRIAVEHRSDDSEEIVRVRLEEYENETRPLLDYYRKMNILRSIDGVGSAEEVSQRLEASLQI